VGSRGSPTPQPCCRDHEGGDDGGADLRTGLWTLSACLIRRCPSAWMDAAQGGSQSSIRAGVDLSRARELRRAPRFVEYSEKDLVDIPIVLTVARLSVASLRPGRPVRYWDREHRVCFRRPRVTPPGPRTSDRLARGNVDEVGRSLVGSRPGDLQEDRGGRSCPARRSKPRPGKSLRSIRRFASGRLNGGKPDAASRAKPEGRQGAPCTLSIWQARGERSSARFFAKPVVRTSKLMTYSMPSWLMSLGARSRSRASGALIGVPSEDDEGLAMQMLFCGPPS